MSTPAAPRDSPHWQLDAGLARLAFGTISRRRREVASQATSHLAFLQSDSLELDLSDPQQRALGDYELLEILGEGGMGVVYRAHQHSLDREVALKLLAAGPWASEEFIAGFRREAQNAALLQHPNIVAVYAMGEHDGLIYYAMELMRGQSLAQRLQAGPLPPREAAGLLRTVAEAVDYAHRLGVLHLDLKPGNILLERDGRPKVSDFGLARRLGQSLSLENERISGTPSYMAPEQAQIRSARLTPATDVWGLGAILYELLTGVPPFLAATPEETLRLVREGRVRRISRHAKVARDLEAVCLRCLENEPARRYASARELADDLGHFLEGRAVSVRPLNVAQRLGRWARREPQLATASGIAFLALVGGLVATTQQWRRAENNATTARTQLWMQRGENAWRSIGEGRVLDALSPLVLNLGEQEATGAEASASITRTRIGSLLSESPALIQVIRVGEPVFIVTMPRDGRWIAAGTQSGTVHVYDLPSGRERWRVDTRKATHFMMQATHLGHIWPATDGRHLLAARPYPDPLPFPSGHNQLSFDLRTGALWKPAEPGFRDATFSPDATHVLVRTEDFRTRLVRASDNQPVSGWRAFDPANPAWLLAPQGRHVAMAATAFRVLELWGGDALRTRASFRFDEGQDIRSWVFTPDAKQLVVGHRSGQISLIDTGTGELTALQPQRPAAVTSVRISEDGAWLAAAYDDGHALVWDLARRELLIQPMRVAAHYFSLDIDRDTRTAFVRDERMAEVWRLPERPGAALLLHRRPGQPPTRYGRSNGWAPAAGLMTSGTLDGELRLWRTHQRAPLPWAPSPQPTDTAFDGRHVVAVNDASVQVMDATTLRAAGPAMAYPQPVGFAFLAGKGDTLVASTGRRVHVADWRRGVERFLPIVLDNSPNRLLATPDGAVVIASELIRSGNLGRTRISAYSLADGRRLASIELESPLHGMRLSGDGRSLCVWRFAELHVLDSHSLMPLHARFRLWPDVLPTRQSLFRNRGPIRIDDPSAFWGETVMDADVDRDAGLAWVLTAEPHRLRALRLQDGATVHDVRVKPSGLIEATPHGVFVLSAEKGVLRYTPSQGLRALASVADIVPGVLARSGDGRRLAVSTGRGAMLLDAQSGEWLTLPFQLVEDATDTLHALSLDQKGEALLVQTLRRRFVVPLSRESRPAATLASLATAWRPEDEVGTGASSPQSNARPNPTQRDPGAESMAPKSIVVRVPAQVRPTQDRYVDLRPRCNVRGDDDLREWPPVALLRSTPRGEQRLLGRDFWIDCGVALSMPNLDGDGTLTLPVQSEAIPIRMHRLAGVDVLLTGRGTTPDFTIVPYAEIELRYRDGGRTRLPIQARTQVWPWWHDGTDLPQQPLAYLSQFASTSTWDSWLSLARFYAVQLENPHPEREVESLAISATHHAWSSPLVLAITLQPPTTPRHASASR